VGFLTKELRQQIDNVLVFLFDFFNEVGKDLVLKVRTVNFGDLVGRMF